MRGEDVQEAQNASQDARSFAMKSPWTRMAIAVMGPTSNLILPIVVFSALYWVGMPSITTKIGSVLPVSPAKAAGLKPGDSVTAINGKQIWQWEDMERIFRGNAGKPLELAVKRGSESLKLTVTPKSEKDSSVFGEEIAVGKIGVSPSPYRPVIGISSNSSRAYKLGLRTGDVITKVNQTPITYWWELQEIYSKLTPPIQIEVERYEAPISKMKSSLLTFELKEHPALKDLGLEEGELYIREVKENSVAEAHGIKAGDRLFAINGESLGDWTRFQEKIQQNEGEKLVLTLIREGEKKTITFVPKEIVDRNSLTRENEKRRQFGVLSAALPGELSQRDEVYRNPVIALYHGLKHTVEMTTLTIEGLGRLISGKLPVKKALGGPISIFYLAGGSYETGGWAAFFRMMALLSITLGVINLLPIPPLDGGHIFFYSIEAIKGSPLNLRAREMIQQVGMALIICLMILTFYVDIQRYFLDRIRALFN